VFSNKRLWIRFALTTPVAVVLSLVLFVVYSQREFLERARAIRVGDTKAAVERQLGAPTHRFAKGAQFSDALRQQNLLLWLLIPKTPETWVYGTPFRLIWLAPEEEDIVVEFDEQGKVTRVVIPQDKPRAQSALRGT